MATPHHVENPFEYAVERLAWAVRDFARFLIPHPERHAGQVVPQVRKIGVADLRDALRKGVEDMGALRDDVLFIAVIYPIAGLVLAAAAFNYNLLSMLFPLAAGFAIVGPVAATGLYEMSRRREEGQHVTWIDAFKVFSSPAIGSIAGMGLILLSLFGLWLAAAYQIGLATLGPETPPTLRMFMDQVFRSEASGALILGGVGVGFLFAALAFAISVVSVPLLLDRPDANVITVIATSIVAVRKNPATLGFWAVLIAGFAGAGLVTLYLGLIVTLPLIGHATWHAYRDLVDFEGGCR